MCDCGSNVVDLQQLKIYIIMAEYKAKLSSGTTYKDGVKIKWATASQEELAHAYEVLGMTSLVEKTEKTEKTKTRKSDAKKVSEVKETNGSEKESSNEEKDKE